MSGLDLQNCINKHGSIYLNENPWQNVFRISRNLSSFTNPALSGTESQDRQHARHYLERRRGCGESGRIRETDYRGIAPDGKRSFHSWARRQQPKKEAECNAKPEVNRKEKKALLVHPTGKNRNLGEQIFTQGRGGPQIRPFAESAPVECRGYSEALQRVMTDFGANDAFAGAAAKLKEHYGIEVAVGAVRGSTGGTRGHDAGRNQNFGETRG